MNEILRIVATVVAAGSLLLMSLSALKQTRRIRKAHEEIQASLNRMDESLDRQIENMAKRLEDT